MVRSEDPPGKTKHLRFGKISPEIINALIGYPGVKSIVRHEGGTKGGSFKEHAHIHVWFESDIPITNQTVRNRLSKLPEFATHSGQNDWSFRNHDSLSNWCAYVIKNPTYSVLLTHTEIEKTIKETPLEYPVVVRKGDTIEHVGTPEQTPLAGTQAPRKSRAMRVQFVEWLEEHLKWEKCETITPDNSHEMVSVITDELCDFWEMAFAFNQAIQMVNHAHWYFANPPERHRIRSKFQSAILKSNYLV